MTMRRGGLRIAGGFRLFIPVAMMVLLAVSGCSDSNNNSSSGSSAAPTASSQGQFVDSAVEGVCYSCGDINSVTDADGYFQYNEGDTIQFSIGSIALGSAVTAKSVLSPIDLVPDASDVNNPAVINLLRFLQTLDENGDPEDGITISETVRELAEGLSLDFSLTAAEFETAAQSVINTLLGEDAPELVSVDAAREHFLGSVRALVTTTRDDRGVWFITGEEYLYSVYEAMGYAVAEDRLWQAELFRRQSRGTLAEVFGPDQLETDVFARTIGYTEAELQAAFDALEQDIRIIISAYVDGFNRRIAEVSADPSILPFEFAAIGAQMGAAFVPAPWTPTDVMAWQAAMLRNFDPEAFSTGQLDNATLFQELQQKFPADFYAMFEDLRWVNDPAALTYIHAGDLEAQTALAANALTLTLAQNTCLPEVELAAAALTLSERYTTVRENLEEIDAYPRMGSYAWVVAGDKTASGNPILYSGPQMGFMVPSIILEGSVNAGNLKVSGMGIAGLPGIVIGRTPHHAWSMQVGHNHSVDYYFENPADVTLDRLETIHVAGGEDVILPVYKSSHGPVVNPLPYDPETYEADPANPIVTWRYAHKDYELETITAYYDLTLAQSMEEFGEALTRVGVSQHFCYVDRDGNIAYWMSGRNPVRPEGDYRFPQGMMGPQLEWDDAAVSELSHHANPAKGYYGGWNNKSAPDVDNSFNEPVYYFGPFHRAHVIDEYLAARDSLTFEEIRDLALSIATTDSIRKGGNPWIFVAEDFAAAVQADPTAEREAALAMIADWDGHFVEGGTGAWAAGIDRADAWVLTDAWIREAVRLTFADELATATLTWEDHDITVLFNALIHGLDGDQASVVNSYDWFQNLADDTSPQSAQDIIVTALDNALAALGELPWGEAARGEIEYNHDMLGTVWKMPFSSRSTYAHCVEYDASGPVRIESMFPLGESGDITMAADGSPVFDDHFFSMTDVYDGFAHRAFPLFEE